ncbi:TNR6A protein, partial [Amia calva]|nr:TNR6A protein [Amia calva]
PANPNSGTSTVTSTVSNAKRAPASSQPQAPPRYPPREVPPRFRQHEQKQLLKRGQPLPVLAANLGTRAQPTNGQLGGALPVSEGPLQNGTKTQHPDLNHTGLGSHYENSHWGSGSPGSDLNTNWDKVIVDGCDKEAWPSITGSDPELASECMDADSASSSGSEKNLSIMASGNIGGDSDGNRHGNGHGSHFMVANGGNNVGNGSIKGPWGTPHGSMLSTCQGPGENPNGKLTESSHGKLNAWGTLGSSTNGGINPSTLNPNANHGAWPVLENSGQNPHGPVGNGNGGTNIQRSTIGQSPSGQSFNSKMGISAHTSWGSLQDNNSESEVNGTSKVSLSEQPQNLNTEMNGPNNTTNMMTSSLPNSTGSMQMNELPTGHRAWRVGSGSSPQLQASSVSNGTSISQKSNSDGMNGGSYGTAWGAPTGTNYSGDKCPVPKGQAVGDTVNATLMHMWAKSAGSEGSGESTGSRSDRMSGDGSRTRDRRKANPQGLVQTVLSRNDLDPRVLSNTGWGQTPVRQNTAWDTEAALAADKKTDNGTEAWGGGGSVSQASNSGGWGDRPSTNSSDTSSVSEWADRKPASGWGDTKGSSSQGGWEESSAATGVGKSNQSWGNSKEDKSSTWNDAQKVKQGWMEGQKPNQGWGAPARGEGWGSEAQRGNHWGEAPKPVSGGWESDGDRSGSGWSEPARSGNNNTWKGNGGGNTPNTSGPTGWGEPSKANNQSQGWGEPPKPSHPNSGWGDSAKPHNSPDWIKPQDPAPAPNSSSWGGAAPQSGPPAPNKSSGWLGGPIPAAPKEEESTGWEEPSPESIRRKMEIDDGTAAWGDPNKYNYNNVNMWNKNSVSEPEAQAPPPPPQQQQQQQQPPPSQPPPSAIPSKDKTGSSGWGEPYAPPPPKVESSWGESSAPPVAVDNGTSAWGKPMDTGTGSWSGATVGQQPQHKPGPKPMQDSWCGEEISMSGTGQPSWEEEDVEIGMWKNNPPQEMSPSGNWPSYMKKMPPKGNVKGGSSKQDDAWMNQFVKQFNNNIGFSRESSEEALKSNKMEMPTGMMADKRMDVDKHGLNMGEYNGVIGKSPGSRHHISKESSMERSPYYDKLSLSLSGQDGIVAEEPPNVQFSSNQNMKLPPSSNALPNQSPGNMSGLNLQNLNSVRQNVNPNMYSGSNAAAQVRSTQQPPAQPLNSSQPNLRAQVPPPLLSPQVPPSLLKYPPNNGGLNPLFGPQQVAMLNQLSQLNQLTQLSHISQLQRLLIQQQKVQNQRNMPLGRQQQEQQGRPLSQSHQMMQPPRHLDPSLMKQQPSPQPPSLHQPGLKSYLENFMPPNAPDLQKEQSALSSFSNFPLGLNSNLNVNNLDIGSISFKEPQSRLKKWTALDISVNSPLDQNSSKPGAISSGLRLDDSPFGPFDYMNTSSSPVSPPGSVGDGWPNRAKSPHGSSNVNWPPEFRPGEPWKGYPNIDPETDPYVTPGSVINNLSINTVRDVDHLRDRNNGSTSSLNTTLPSTSAWSSICASNYSGSLSSTAQSTSARNSDSKSTWTPGAVTNTSLAHELWKVPLPPKGITAPSRPPPGLTGQKPPSSWDNSSLRLGGGWGGSDSRYTPGSSWGDNSSGRTTNWLVLKNLTPQIDGSTLRTLCMQHGPLITFHLNLPHGNAVVCYSSKEEAAKAQKSLHMCVLGNTTILAEFASEEEISRFFAQGQSMTASPSWQALGASRNRIGSMESSHPFSNRNDPNHWNGAGLSGAGSGDLHGTSLWGAPNYSTSLWGNPSGSEGRGMSSPSSFLPVDHLAGGGDSM